MRTAWLLMVMPRSRSMSMRSRYWARALRSSTTPVSCSIRSASVDLPWSMWAMMQKLRIRRGSVCPGNAGAGTWDFQDSSAGNGPLFHAGSRAIGCVSRSCPGEPPHTARQGSGPVPLDPRRVAPCRRYVASVRGPAQVGVARGLDVGALQPVALHVVLFVVRREGAAGPQPVALDVVLVELDLLQAVA